MAGIGGLRGSAPARIDDKGRLKVPAMFRGAIRREEGADVFVTSLTGECVQLYPMPVWIEVERKLATMPSSHPVRQKYVDRVNYWGQQAELDDQGRVLIPAHLRQKAAIVGEVRVFGRIDYVEIWNEERFVQKLERDAWTDEDGLQLSEHGI